MLHQVLKVKELNNFSNRKSVASNFVELDLKVIERHRDASKLKF